MFNLNYKKINKCCCLTFFTISVFAFLYFSIFSYSKAVSSNLSNCVLRLHVIANSDSIEDQELKYKVRDSLIEYMNYISTDLGSKKDVVEIVKNNLDNYKKIAENVIAENGFNYPVTIELGNFSFPTKTYGDVSFPSGYYDALRVKIGESYGQNWWCVMFPPLCFVDVTSGIIPDESKENLQKNLSVEDFDIISKNNSISNFKFKIVELFNDFSIKIANK